MLETFAEHKHFGGDAEGAKPLLERALAHLPPPESGVKALLDRGKNHVLLSQIGTACPSARKASHSDDYNAHPNFFLQKDAQEKS